MKLEAQFSRQTPTPMREDAKRVVIAVLAVYNALLTSCLVVGLVLALS